MLPLMAHAGLLLFLATVLLAAISGLWLRTLRARTAAAGRFDIRASAERGGFDAALLMRVSISLLVLIAALFIILSKQYDGDQQKWAFGTIGTVLGYWLKT